MRSTAPACIWAVVCPYGMPYGQILIHGSLIQPLTMRSPAELRDEWCNHHVNLQHGDLTSPMKLLPGAYMVHLIITTYNVVTRPASDCTAQWPERTTFFDHTDPMKVARSPSEKPCILFTT